MKKKECPSCAMMIDSGAKICPVCGYEFAETSAGIKWTAILLIVLIVFYFLFRLLKFF